MECKVIENIIFDKKLLAIIVSDKFDGEGIQFFTQSDDSLQLGYMKRSANYVISPHIHNCLPRKVDYSTEVLIVKSGLVKVDFYDDDLILRDSRFLYPGYLILLRSGGHGFTMIQDSEIYEVKQGPYMGESDKTRF